MRRFVARARDSAVFASRATWLLPLLLAAAASAQTTFDVIPSRYRQDVTAGLAEMGTPWWLTAATRRVDVYSPTAIGFNTGLLRQLAFRPYEGATNSRKASSLDVWLSYSKFAPDALPQKFSQLQLVRRVRVFRGVVNLPASTASRRWVPIKLAAPFLFARIFGSFVIETQARSMTTNIWFMDCATTTHDWKLASSRSLGLGCRGSSSAIAMRQRLRRRLDCVPGGQLSGLLYGSNTTSRSVLQIMGFRNKAPFPIDLTRAGAPRCWLYTSPDVTRAVPVCCLIPSRYSIALWNLPLPNDSRLSGLSINSQFIDIDRVANRLGMVFSDGLECRIGGRGQHRFRAKSGWTWAQGQFGLSDWMATADDYEFVAIYRLGR